MSPNEVLVLHAMAKTGKATMDSLERNTGIDRQELFKAARALAKSGHLVREGTTWRKRLNFLLTKEGKAAAKGPQLASILEGRQVFTTMLNSRVNFCPPVDDPRNLMSRPTYAPPRLQAPIRAGALDASRLPSKGMT